MMSLREILRKGSASILDLIYPLSCAHCGARLAPEEGGLCAVCFSQIPKNLPPFCLTCGRQKGALAEGSRCCACEGKSFSFDRLWFVAPYEGILRESLHKLKYKGEKPLTGSLSQLLIVFAKKYLFSFHFDAALPVPLAPLKERERSFNQSALFAKALATALSVPYTSGNLLRVRATLPQVSLQKSERLENMEDAFRVKDPSLYVGKNLLLVDDVVTTGATVSSASKVLRERGAKTISVLALARGATG